MTSDRTKIRCVPFAELTRVKSEIDGEVDAVNWLLKYMADSLPRESPTAKAVERSAPWEEILRLARWEGVFEIAALLEDAFKTLFLNKPFRPKCESRKSR